MVKNIKEGLMKHERHIAGDTLPHPSYTAIPKGAIKQVSVLAPLFILSTYQQDTSTSLQITPHDSVKAF